MIECVGAFLDNIADSSMTPHRTTPTGPQIHAQRWYYIGNDREKLETLIQERSKKASMKMPPFLSERAAETVSTLDLPWRFAPRSQYHPEDNPNGLISFATAENALVTDEVLEFARKKSNLSSDDFLYRGSVAGGPRFPNALATHLNEYLQPHQPITPDMIRCVGAATAMHDILAWAVANPKEGILTSRPVYGRFELDFGNKSQVKVVYSDTNAENCFDETVVNRFEEELERSNAAGTQVRMLLIVNPNNPLGKCYPRGTLIKIMQFCQKHQLHLLSDEIYACSVFETDDLNAIPFTSILSIDSTSLIDPQLLHVTYGMSKDFGAAGLRLGAIITRSRPIVRAIDGVMRFHNPSGASLAIASAMLEDRQWCRSFIESSRGKLAAAYAHVTRELRDMGVRYFPGSNAGFFVWVDLSPHLPTGLGEETPSEFTLAAKLMDAGVFLHPMEEHSSKPGWFRLVYTQDPKTVTEGLRRIKTVICE